MIENELKYVLSLDSKDAVHKVLGEPLLVKQGYLPGKARIRSKVKGRGQGSAILSPKFFFTYKLPVETEAGEVVFEIEKEITKHEFETLWPHTEARLVKLRYTTMEGPVQWDIDYFLAGAAIYFAMAEAEMPEDMLEPPSIPAWLQGAITYPVPRAETRKFTSNKVADEAYANKLLSGINKKKRKKNEQVDHHLPSR